MKILIVDDEPLARARLTKQLESIAGYEVVGEAGSGLQAIEKAESLQADILLLDIRMPGMDGLEVSKYLSRMENPPAVIFTTAYSEYALDAFEAHAVAYLMKPVHQDKLAAALASAKKLTRAQIEEVEDDVGAVRKQICARVRGNLELINLDDIYYFRADSKYVELRYRQGHVLIEEPLTSLEEEFNESFIRVHRNALVAKALMASLKKNDEGHSVVCFADIEDTIEISRRHLPKVRALFKG